MESVIAEHADPWADEGSRSPVAFSQVREDPGIDCSVLAELVPNARVFMIASGGDTAALIAASGMVEHLHLVDFNPAQLALTRLKFLLLRDYSSHERLEILGHLPIPAEVRAGRLREIFEKLGLAEDAIGPFELVSRLGPDHSGRYELLFQQLRECLAEQHEEIADVLALENLQEQARRGAPDTALGKSMDAAFHTTMRLENLVCLFGREATQNAQRPFSEHFADRTRHALATLPARKNPFLAQLLAGRFPNGATYDWLEARPPKRWPETTFTHSTAVAALRSLPEDSMDFVHLSNILDWLSPDAATETLSLAWNALRPGGLVVIRQLNSTVEIRGCEPRFHWRERQADKLHSQDRSFFYRALFIGEKPRVE